MNDEVLEQQLRALTAPELPEAWRAEILANTLREAQVNGARTQRIWPPLFIILQKLFSQNPYTASVLTMLWLLILLFKTSTPVDPTEKELMAHFDPNRPVNLVSLQDEVWLAETLQDGPEQRRGQAIP